MSDTISQTLPNFCNQTLHFNSEGKPIGRTVHYGARYYDAYKNQHYIIDNHGSLRCCTAEGTITPRR